MKAATIKSFMRKPHELFLVVRMILFLLFLPFMLRLARIQDVVAKITPRVEKAQKTRMNPERVTYLCERSLALLQGFGYRVSCLKRCLAMYHFLRVEGVPVAINFGASWQGDTLKGHSWLTLDGALYLEAQEKVDQFVYFFSLPPLEAESGPRGGRKDEKDLDIGRAFFD